MKIGLKNSTSRKPAPPLGGQFFPHLSFHDDWQKKVTLRKTAPPPESHIFPPILTIFELVHDINKTNILTNHARKTVPPPGGHVFQPTRTIFELKKRMIWTNVLTKFHEDRTRNAVSSVHKAKAHDGQVDQISP
ncbi:hypothetical protein DPMN_072334 [Dreissena polymorpha]|uniref:Uncharacterized protein n=1 Tax=Dreissena polymorpha TaxID=45954 RepID=A0A9D3Z618_DREPO|nr:hypothetical protein DPMN_072334 [Dreissena polymorpha]